MRNASLSIQDRPAGDRRRGRGPGMLVCALQHPASPQAGGFPPRRWKRSRNCAGTSLSPRRAGPIDRKSEDESAGHVEPGLLERYCLGPPQFHRMAAGDVTIVDVATHHIPPKARPGIAIPTRRHPEARARGRPSWSMTRSVLAAWPSRRGRCSSSIPRSHAPC